jgi:hypothetical protein
LLAEIDGIDAPRDRLLYANAEFQTEQLIKNQPRVKNNQWLAGRTPGLIRPKMGIRGTAIEGWEDDNRLRRKSRSGWSAPIRIFWTNFVRYINSLEGQLIFVLDVVFDVLLDAFVGTWPGFWTSKQPLDGRSAGRTSAALRSKVDEMRNGQFWHDPSETKAWAWAPTSVAGATIDCALWPRIGQTDSILAHFQELSFWGRLSASAGKRQDDWRAS